MCGIAGILGRIDDRNRAALERMSRAMLHRGPDGGASWTSPADARGFGCMLAHRRLSILDLSVAADQPMVDPGTGDTLVFNGEIYNFQGLRDELRRAGVTTRSTGDTEVLLHALEHWGPDAVRRLRGMFAFGLWKAEAQELVLARDPLGMKPLYVAVNPEREGDWSLLFASEVRAMLASGLLGQPRIHPVALSSYLWNGFAIGKPTVVRGIEALGPGELRVADGGGHTRRSTVFWTIPRPGEAGGEGGSADGGTLSEVLAESVRLHLLSDVPLGVFLSGGIDSSAVANLARRNGSEVHTLTITFEEAEFDESRYAREVAQRIGAEHHEIPLTEARFVENLAPAIDAIDRPTLDGVNTYFVALAAREAGLKVALVGTGGDELFGGYASFSKLPRARRMLSGLGSVPGASGLGARGLEVWSRLVHARHAIRPQSRYAKLSEMLRAGPDMLRLYQLAYALYLPDLHRALMRDPPAEDEIPYGIPVEMVSELVQESGGRGDLEALSVLEQRCFLGERLLRDSDVSGMAASIEIRMPLVDVNLVECLARMPTMERYHPVGRKDALRRAGLVGLDPQLFERPKRGFYFPWERWLHSRLGQQMDELMRDQAVARSIGLDGALVESVWTAYRSGARGLPWSRVWALYVLLHWCRKHGVTN